MCNFAPLWGLGGRACVLLALQSLLQAITLWLIKSPCLQRPTPLGHNPLPLLLAIRHGASSPSSATEGLAPGSVSLCTPSPATTLGDIKPIIVKYLGLQVFWSSHCSGHLHHSTSVCNMSWALVPSVWNSFPWCRQHYTSLVFLLNTWLAILFQSLFRLALLHGHRMLGF